jgi:hypothetical protein
MRKALRAFAPSALFIEALFLVPLPALAAQDVLVAPRLAVVGKGPPISRLPGPVWNDKGQRIGAISDFIFNSDYTLFAVIQVGGFLAIGGYLVAIPFKILVIDQPVPKIVPPGATPRSAPELSGI